MSLNASTARRAPAKRAARPIGDEAVRLATGRDWKHWVAALNRADAKPLAHREIARLVHEKFGVASWWAQMVTVGYEQATGRRAKHQRPDGFSVTASKTVAVPVDTLFAAWTNPRRRARWLPAPVTIRKATPHKSMRVTWRDGKTILAVGFFPKGPAKAQVALEHGRLKSKAEAARIQAFWRQALDRLKVLLEG